MMGNEKHNIDYRHFMMGKEKHNIDKLDTSSVHMEKQSIAKHCS